MPITPSPFSGAGEIRTGLFDGRPGTSGGFSDYNAYITVNATAWTQYTQSIMAATDTAIAEFILSFRSTNAANDHLQIDDVSITTGAASIDTVSIYDIQYTTDVSGNSPYMEMMVRTTGVVTGKNTAGYFIQDGACLWKGLYIFDSGNAVAIGDSVSMTGRLKEYFNFTELTSVTSFVKHASGVALPPAAFIPVGSVRTEAYESVLVTVSNVTCKSTNAGYGMWSVVQGNDTCKVDTFLYKFTPALNAHYDITAIVNYGFSEYRLSPRSAADVQIASGIADINTELKVHLYPNPTSGNIKLSSETPITGIRVYSMNGVLVLSETMNTKQAELTLEQLASGIYLLQVDLNDNTSTSMKISVQ